MKKIFQKIYRFLKKHKVALVVVIVLFLMSRFVAYPRAKTAIEGPIAKYETVKVKKQDIQSTVSASGKIQAENQVTLKFQTSGKLAWVGVKEGDRVKKWQAMASLDKQELEKNLKKDLNDYLNERWDFAEDRESYLITTDDLDQYTLTNEARRILDKAQFDLNNKVLDVEISDLAIKLATIISPIDGLVIDVEAPIAGVNITPATAEFTVADPSEMKFAANVDESDIGLIRPGQKAEITLDTYPEEIILGEVAKIAFSSVKTSGGGTAFPVEIYLPENNQEKFKIGMNGDVEMVTSQESNTLVVSSRAIAEKNGKKTVQIIEGKSIKEVEVKTGLESDTKTQILGGLDEGQTVIIGEKKKQ